MAIRTSYGGKLYRNNAGTWGTPTWDEITIAKNITLSQTMEEADATVKGSGGAKMSEPTLVDLSIDFEVVLDNAHADLIALRSAFTGRTSIIVALATADITTVGETYTKFEAKVFKFEESQDITGIQMVAVTLKPCYSTNVPTFTTAA